jgi:hypothetical protein
MGGGDDPGAARGWRCLFELDSGIEFAGALRADTVAELSFGMRLCYLLFFRNAALSLDAVRLF